MARYIDADLEVQKINETQLGISDKNSVGYFALEQFKIMLKNAPTADVVPKSEVEGIFEEIDLIHKKSVC